MLKELGIFLLGAAAIGLAFLFFSVELPLFHLWDLSLLESLKYGVSLLTAAAVLAAVLWTGA